MKFFPPFFILSLFLFCTHYFILNNITAGELFIPLHEVYLFNILSVTIIYCILFVNHKATLFFNPLALFIFLTMIKMGLVVIILFPLFDMPNENLTFEILNFFGIYFVFQTLEIIGLKLLLK